jgi:hypothetical protein
VKRHCLILPFIPWLASCDPITVHVFEPQVSGTPVRTPEAQARLRQAVVDAAARHDFVLEKTRAEGARLIRKGEVVEEVLLDYHKNAGRLGMELHRDHSSGTDKVRLVDVHRFRRSKESEVIESEIQAGLR